MGAVPGVGVVGEIRSANYQKGQIYNRPVKPDAEWILFRLQHYNRFCNPFNFDSTVQFINSEIAPAPAYSASGSAPDLDAAVPYPGATIDGGVYQNSRAYCQRLNVDGEGSPRLYPPDQLSIQWQFRQGADQVLPSAGFEAATLHNSIIGFKLPELISQLNGESECRIAFSARSYIIEQNIPIALREGKALIRSAGVTMQYADQFVTEYDQNQPFLDVAVDDRLAAANDFQGVRLGGANAPQTLYGNGSELIASFILNVVDRSLSRPESVLSIPPDSLLIPAPSKWTASYVDVLNELIN